MAQIPGRRYQAADSRLPNSKVTSEISIGETDEFLASMSSPCSYWAAFIFPHVGASHAAEAIGNRPRRGQDNPIKGWRSVLLPAGSRPGRLSVNSEQLRKENAARRLFNGLCTHCSCQRCMTSCLKTTKDQPSSTILSEPHGALLFWKRNTTPGSYLAIRQVRCGRRDLAEATKPTTFPSGVR